MNPVAPLLHGFRVGLNNNGSPAVAGPPYISDTKQIAWHSLSAKRGCITVDSERSQSVIGWLQESPPGTRHLTTKLANRFGAVTLVAMDAAPVARAKKLLLSVGIRSANRGMQWNEKRTSTVNGGEPGMLIEAPEGSVVLRGIGGKRVEVIPLDGGGRAAGAAIAARKVADGWQVELTGTATPWYLVRVAR
jgi:hypothetical protein